MEGEGEVQKAAVAAREEAEQGPTQSEHLFGRPWRELKVFSRGREKKTENKQATCSSIQKDILTKNSALSIILQKERM